MITRKNILITLLLLFILALAASLRFYNLNWDDGTYAHPDERSTLLYYAPTMLWPEDTADLLDPRTSTLNPFWNVNENSRRSYTYGHFPLYVLVLTANAFEYLAPMTVDWLPEHWTEFMAQARSGRGFAQIGRALMALADLAIVFLLFLIGRRLYGPWGGLLAAALSAVTVLQIQLAHFFAVDTVSTTFTVLAIYGAMLMVDRRSAGAALLTGMGIGLAVSSKYSALPVAFVPLGAAFLALVQQTQPPDGEEDCQPPVFGLMLSLALLAWMTAFIVFAVTSPFVLLDFDNFYQAVVEEQGRMVSGVADMPFTRQYRGTTAYWYFIEQQLRWGMGWPLGLLALAGTVWTFGKALFFRAKPDEWLILGWILLYFGPTGLFLAKFMRYMIPVVPFFTLFGVGLIVALWNYQRKAAPSPLLAGEGALSSPPLGGTEGGQPSPTSSASEGEQSDTNGGDAAPKDGPHPSLLPAGEGENPSLLARSVALMLTAVVLLGTIVWAGAFVNGVYGTEHTWVTFARWVYANVPDNSCIAWEHWDDRQPVDVREPDLITAGAKGYRQPQLPMYEEDTLAKYEQLRTTLSDCDYVVLATNRLWRTIPKLPERYPMSNRYYEALFSGELGYEQVHSVETPPTLAGFTIDSQPADESFTVYDHPKPILFKKVRQLSDAEWDDVLALDGQGRFRWEQAKPGYIGDTTLLMRLRGYENRYEAAAPAEIEPPQKSLLLDVPVRDLAVVDDFRWNDAAIQSPQIAVAVWWLAFMGVGLLAWPLTYHLFYKLPDRGYILSKSLGALLLSYFVWLNSSLGLLGNRLTTILTGLIILSMVSVWLLWRSGRQIGAFSWRIMPLILITELLFGLVYLFFIYLRLQNPDLWQPWLGGEKMLEIGFLTAIVKSAAMPPYDPFFAGGIINYYYYGMFIVGVFIKLTGIPPTIAFNLAIPMLAALTAANVFCLARNLAAMSFAKSPKPLSGLSSGLLAVLLVIFMGNLEGMFQFMRNLSQLSSLEFETAIPGLTTLVLAVDGFKQLFDGATLLTYNYWDPTRVIPATINEFPYFSFLFADLHPHMMGIPFTVLMLNLAYNLLLPEPIDQPPHESHDSNGVTFHRSQADIQSATTLAVAREEQPLKPLYSETTALNRSVQKGGQSAPPPESSPSGEPVEPDFDKLSLPASTNTLVMDFLGSLAGPFFRWLALPFVLGAIAVINTWDLPTYLGLIVATYLLYSFRLLQGRLIAREIGLILLTSPLFAISMLVATYLLYWPFFANYQAIDVGLGLVHTQTPLDGHLKIWGFFIFVVASWLWLSLLRPNSRNGLLRAISLRLRCWNVFPHLSQIHGALVQRQTLCQQLGLWLMLPVLLGVAALIWFEYYVPAYLLLLVFLATLLLFRRDSPAATNYVGLMVFTGLLLLLGVEVFVLKDFLGGGDHYRMNTLFKFFMQVWILFGLATAIILPHLWIRTVRWPLWRQFPWLTISLLLLLSGFIYPLLATNTRLNDRFPGSRPETNTLDGLAYMTVGQFEWPAGNLIELQYDYQAIHWLMDNVPGTPILAEAKIGYYREGGMRVAAYTGLPSILGSLHQGEQRYAEQIGQRDFPVRDFWDNPDPAQTRLRLEELGIDYIYVGQIERITHGQQVDQTFEQLAREGVIELVYQNPKTKIYRRVL